jgi:hypothetical protein
MPAVDVALPAALDRRLAVLSPLPTRRGGRGAADALDDNADGGMASGIAVDGVG